MKRDPARKFFMCPVEERPVTRARTALWLTLVSVALAVSLPAHSEVIEEIVAKVNDDIITKTQIEGEERALIAEIYRRYTGPDLDHQVQMARKHLLQQMIDAKILVHRAERLYDMDVVKGVLLENFMNDQGIKSETELRGMLAQQGASLEQLEERLVAMFVPEEVIRFEVVGRESVGEREVEAYYHEHIKDYEIPAEVTLREIVLVAERRLAGAQRLKRSARASPPPTCSSRMSPPRSPRRPAPLTVA
jgi:peptidyl-prolyl cis-trans isomerase SurA